MNKHTPGPWKVYRRADYTTPGWVVLWPDASKPGTHYRRLDSNGGFIEQDARLIAAAPDLLEALQGLLRGIFDGPDKANAAMLIAKARDAVNKATGEK